MTDERQRQLYDLWENEVTAEDEEWRYDLTEEEAAMVEEWDNQYDSGTASLASRILDAAGRRQPAQPDTEKGRQR